MNPVKHIHVNLLDDEICYGPEKDQNNITPEMRKKWDEVFPKVEETLRGRGFLTSQTVIKKEDGSITFILNEPLLFCEALNILKIIETLFKVTSFSFNSVYDEWYEEEPCVKFGIYSKK